MISFGIINLIVLIILVYILLRYDRNNDSQLDIQNTMTIRAFLILLIISHHVSFHVQIPHMAQLFFESIGGILTGGFFFLSGFGNFLSYKKYKKISPEIGIHWIIKRLASIVIPFEILLPIMFFSTDIDILTRGGQRANYLKYALSLRFPGKGLFWFVKIMCLCYIIFFVCFFLIRISENYQRKLLFILFFIYVTIMIALKANKVWWSSVLCFWLGIKYATDRVNIDAFLNRRNVVPILLFLLCIIHISNLLISGIFEIPDSLLFCLLIVALNHRKVVSNKYIKKIGESSYEIYLLHGGFVSSIFSKVELYSNAQCLLIYLISCIGAIAIHDIYKKILGKLLNR